VNLSTTTPLKTKSVDEDLAEQAHPGHGIPSQEPESAAQFSLKPEEAEREAKSVLIGGGVVAGAATGATVGVAVAGPVGVLVGGTLGAVVGALGAVAAGSMVNPERSSSADTAPADTVHLHTEGSAGSASGGKPTARVDKVIAASAPKIWTALTTPAALKQFFFGADVVTNWEVGSPIRMKGEFKGKTYEDKGNIVTFEPPRQLSFSHWSAMSGQADTPANYHLVTFDLVPEGSATKVTLSQANLMGGVTASDIEHRAEYEKNWTSVLDGLAEVSMA
jgi:uncharacterized protein YndB with AHSA1/START domain